MKKLLGVVLLALLGLGASVWWVYQSRAAQLTLAVQRYLPDVLGVPVQVASVRLSPWQGLATLSGLSVGNPQGFQAPSALVVEQVQLRLDLSTLADPVVHVHEVLVRQPQLSLEYAAGGNNLDVIQRQVERYITQHSGAGRAAQTIIIDRWVMRDGRAQAGPPASAEPTVVLPDVHLQDMGAHSGGVTMGDATSQVVAAIRLSVAQARVPKDFHEKNHQD